MVLPLWGMRELLDYDVQANSDDYFAYASIKQIQDNLATKSCPVSTLLTNSPPTINAGSDYTIPNGTAFILKGTGSDVDGDTVTYCWEQNDTAIQLQVGQIALLCLLKLMVLFLDL